MKKSLKNALPFAEAFSRLLNPFAEVVVHDLAKDRIEAIYNPISRRIAGDDSYLDRLEFQESDTIIGPYDKTNWDGRPLKSISVLIRNEEGKAEGFLCINIDVSFFAAANQLLEAFLKYPDYSADSKKLFKDDLYEKINLYVQEYCQKTQVGVEALSRKEKKEIIQSLSVSGAFNGRNAASYIGRVLGLSRATVYNYLKGNANC